MIRHFVTLSYVCSAPDNITEKRGVISGFVIEVLDEWFYITAGHAIEGVLSNIEAGCKYTGWCFGDHTNRFKGMPIPIPFDKDAWVSFDTDDLDYAATPIVGIVRKNLEAGGVESIGKDARENIWNDFDKLLLLGIPSETLEERAMSLEGLNCMIPLERAEAPQNAANPSPNKFYGRLIFDTPESPDISMIEGMSGGPVFGVRRARAVTKYWAVGVQSGVYGNNQIITVCPLSVFADALESLILRLHKKAGESQVSLARRE